MRIVPQLICDRKLAVWLGATDMPARALDCYAYAKLAGSGGFMVVHTQSGLQFLWRVDVDAWRSA